MSEEPETQTAPQAAPQTKTILIVRRTETGGRTLTSPFHMRGNTTISGGFISFPCTAKFGIKADIMFPLASILSMTALEVPEDISDDDLQMRIDVLRHLTPDIG